VRLVEDGGEEPVTPGVPCDTGFPISEPREFSVCVPHGLRDGQAFIADYDQVHVIVHEAVSPYGHPVASGVLDQKVEIPTPLRVIVE
jgi:hypothetical protein